MITCTHTYVLESTIRLGIAVQQVLKGATYNSREEVTLKGRSDIVRSGMYSFEVAVLSNPAGACNVITSL